MAFSTQMRNSKCEIENTKVKTRNAETSKENTSGTLPLAAANGRAAEWRDRTVEMLTRFAPAPTGYLHVGHVVNALFVWGFAQRHGGRVLLRIEDHDRQRSRPEYEAAIFEDLDWLGFVPDVVAPRQSDREDAYRIQLQMLVARGLVYGCDCTRKEIAALRYPGTCRDRGLPLTDDVGWRVSIGHGVEFFRDMFLGPQAQEPESQCGDLLIRDRHANWTYQWAATADDYLQRITHVIRGIDLLDSTGRQLRLARLLGRQDAIHFGHHPLVMKTATQKLSKSDKDTGIRDLRAAGWTRDRVLDEARKLVNVSNILDIIYLTGEK
jgi:glutamyl-tRNA synthetase/glutamyl-Q tRNA(Asp) synthetase